MIKLDERYSMKQMSKFVYEKDFQAQIYKEKLYSIDSNFKTVHLLDISTI